MSWEGCRQAGRGRPYPEDLRMTSKGLGRAKGIWINKRMTSSRLDKLELADKAFESRHETCSSWRGPKPADCKQKFSPRLVSKIFHPDSAKATKQGDGEITMASQQLRLFILNQLSFAGDPAMGWLTLKCDAGQRGHGIAILDTYRSTFDSEKIRWK